MLKLYLGGHGTGKSYAVAEEINRLLPTGKRIYLIVPEQYTLECERQYAALLPSSATLSFEVTNFSRLANTVFRAVGGLSYRYATKSTRHLFLWRALSECGDMLREKGTAEPGRVTRIASAIGELRAAGIRSRQLLKVSEELSEDERLRDRLFDLGILERITAEYSEGRFDNAAEDLDRLAEILETSRFFCDSYVFIDSFTSFTEQEYRLIRLLLRDASLALALTLPATHAESLAYTEVAETLRRIEGIAKRSNTEICRTVFTENRRQSAPLLRHVSENLFRPLKNERAVYQGEDEDGLSLVTAPDAFSAADFIAADIRRRVIGGARYRDFAILARNAESYAGILDVALEKCKIPHHMSTKVDITSFEAIKMIFSAYAILNGGFREKDVLAYLKCHLSGIDSDACDRFELYVSRWKISGEGRYLSEKPFSMNPYGYTSKTDERAEKILRDVNETRDRFRRPFGEFARAARQAKTVDEHSAALIRFLLSLDVPAGLSRHADEAKAEARLRDAEEISRLWDTLIDAIDALSAAIGDAAVNPESYPQLLRLLFREINIARIPSSADAVMVGSADMLRASGVKTVYLFGVNEGEFPASVTDDSIFSDADKRVLASHDLPLKPDLDIRSSRELFAFLRAFTAASHEVSLVSFRFDAAMKPLRPSRVCEEIAMLAGTAAKRVDLDALSPDTLLYGLEAASDRYAMLKDTPFGEALRAALLSDDTAKRKILVSEGKVTDRDCSVTERVMTELYGKSFTLTQTKLETYVKCPFLYFCRYVLRLDDAAPAAFDFRNVGTFVHSALENLFKLLSDEGKTLRDIGREELPSYAERVAEEAVKALSAGEDATTARIRNLMKSICRRILVIMEDLHDEFSESEFVPRFFEMQLSADDGPSPVTYTLPDGTTLVLRGTVDRVDAYKKDGKLYLRVVDYKTGTKRFSLDDIERGINLQLLVYLFSLWKNTRESFRRRLGISPNEEVLPAGMLYMMASTADITLPAPLPPDEVREKAKRALTRSGLLLNDMEILSAMDKGLSGRYIPVTLTKKGEVGKSSAQSLVSLDEMGKLSKRLDEVIKEIGTGIRQGNADAAPQCDKTSNPCEHCEMKKICRKM